MTDPVQSTAERTAATWHALVDAQLRRGAVLPAYDAAVEGLAAFPGDLRLRQLLALALLRAGAYRQASQVLEKLRTEGHSDEETLGMLARTYKDQWAFANEPAERRRFLTQARDAYQAAYSLSRGYWTGINVATTSLLLGETDAAVAAAAGVRDACLAKLRASPDEADRYWVLATLGEAALVEGDDSKALDWYRQAASAADGRLADAVSTRRHARLILRYRDRDTAALDACFQVPAVVVFVGHLMDRPGRAVPRFPATLEPAVRNAIGGWLAACGPVIGFASAACGSDLIFHEGLAERGATSHVVLPFAAAAFIRDSVAIAESGDWPARFEKTIAAAAEVVVASDQRLGAGGASYEYGLRMLDGLAGVRADELDTVVRCLAVWDGREGDGPGGTAAAVEHWRAAGRNVDVIDAARLLRDHASPSLVVNSGAEAVAPLPAPSAFEPQIVAMLFADVAGFSKMSDAELPLFVEHVLGLMATGLDALPEPPLLTNTWGDGLYVAFRSMRAAGRFALWLRDAIRSADWVSRGFATSIDIRIGLHAGPAYACDDPVTRRRNFIGAHVSRAARIEPITPPGEVYASRAFAALARAEGATEFTCRYVGPTPLAKGHGTFPMYVVTERAR